MGHQNPFIALKINPHPSPRSYLILQGDWARSLRSLRFTSGKK